LFIGGRVAERTAIRAWFDRTSDRQTTTALLLYGPRGTGKTTLSGFLAELAAGAGWLTLALRGDTGIPFTAQLAEFADAPRTSATWKLGVDVGVVQASVERALAAAPTDPSLTGVTARLVEQTDNGVLLVVDEAQAAAQRELAGLVAVLEDLADVRGLPVAVAVLGTEKLVGVIGPAGGSLGRLHRSDHVELSVRQTFDETLDICTGTLVDHPGISHAAVAAIHADTGGFPHAVQVFGEAGFARAGGGVIESRHIDAGRDGAYAQLSRQVFQMMWRRQGSRGPAPTRSHEYLGHVAAGERSHTRIAGLIGVEPSSVAGVRQDLIDRGVLVSVDGELEFGIPLMRRFVAEHR
jgi:hypothetical protein